MSKIDDLINKLCPNGVKYYELGELGKFYGGLTGKSKEDFKDGNAKFITYMNVYKNLAIDLDVDDKVKIAENENQRTLEYGDIIFTGSSETPDECGISSVVTIKTDEKLYLNSFCFFYRFDDPTIMNPDFAKHLFRSSNLRYQIGKTASGVTRFNVSKKLMEKVRIAVPPLEVQCEIVHILDDFTLLSAELKARRKQFNYYRDELIKTAHGAEYKTLKEIATDMYRGAGIKRDEVTETGIPCVRYGEIYTTYNVLFDSCVSHTDETKQKSKKYFEYGDVLFAITGESVEEIGKSTVYLGNDKCLAGGDTVVMKHNENPKYIGYALSTTEAQMQKSKGKVKSKVVHSSVPALKEISIPIPSLKEQERIASLIENFDKICNDLSEGLPAEIEKRQKQYEYYRDKLLSFKEVEEDV